MEGKFVLVKKCMRPRKLSQFFSFISQGVCMIVLSITSSSFFFSPVPLPPPPLNPPFSFPFCFGPLSVTASLSIKRERALGPNTALQRTEAERKGGTELGTDWGEYNRVLAFFLCCLRRRLLACFARLLASSVLHFSMGGGGVGGNGAWGREEEAMANVSV